MEKKQPTAGEEKKINYPKDRLLRVMDEVLLDSVDHLVQYSNTCKELQKKGGEGAAEQIEEMSEKLHNTLLELEQDVCTLRGIDIEKYYEDVTQYDVSNDKDVKARLDLLGKLIETALKGEKIVIDFEVAPELTKDATMSLYKTILSSHLHLHYTSVQKYLKSNPKATAEELQAVVDTDDTEKVKRRDSLLEKEKVTRKPGQDYRFVLNSAYYTYLTHDAEFEKQMQQVMKLYGSMLQLVLEQKVLPELKLDPITMTPPLFHEYYNRLASKYMNGMPVQSMI